MFGGCYKKEVFEKVGFLTKKLLRSQDIEFNRRLKAAGGKIMLVPDIVAFYYPQTTFWKFLKHNFQDGIWTIYPLKFGVKIFSFRHLLPLFFVLGMISCLVLGVFWEFFWWFCLAGLLFYLWVSFCLSFKITVIVKKYRTFICHACGFCCRHFGYGAGFYLGIKLKLIYIKQL